VAGDVNIFSMSSSDAGEAGNRFLNSVKRKLLGDKKKHQSSDYHMKVYDIIKQIVCYNQGKILEFNFELSNKHRIMRDVLTEYKGDSTDANKQKLNDARSVLLNYIGIETVNISKVNIGFLKTYYKMRDIENIPRCCIKTVSASKDRIVDNYRDHDAYKGENMASSAIDENTGFSQVLNTGVYYLENNIPEKAIAGYYKNPRLNNERVRRYKKSNRNGEGVDHEWVHCWDGQDPTDYKACYKSTLIIPMTLMNNNDLPSGFMDKIAKGHKSKRTNWGFVCLDSIKEGFFLDDIDVNIGYIVADMLSMYYIKSYIYTDTSRTYNEATTFLRSK